ncbi:MAG: LysM peptidoglycan-binding domain-containing protein [bacterium]|nr:LysM peptidoglycan-binding domain-containing protein [bacterium]MDZ4247982.1 LysM peptidoglycan-binding domain-containing protein [Patescibacteria group bacterium]
MGDEDQQRDEGRQAPPPPPSVPNASGGTGSDKLGSEEAGLHEVAGSGVSMPEWADSLSHGTDADRPKVNVDLAKRLREEDAARIARRKAEEEARRRAAAEAARLAAQKAAQAAARRKAAAHPHPAPAARSASPARTRSRKVSKWPSVLAALAVIVLGAIVGQRIVGGDNAPQESATPFPLASAPSASTAAPASTPPASEPQSSRLDTYKVKPGDTLESIAEQFGRTPTEISRVNGAYGRLIKVRPGQVINIP